MKKIFLAITLLGLMFQACDPMQEINEGLEVEKMLQDSATLFIQVREVAPSDYILTEDDYELSSDEDVAKYKNFSDSKLPSEFLPEILNQKFYGEDAQTMMVSYAFYSKVEKDEENAYVLDSVDYALMGQKYGNFGSEDDAEYAIAKFLDQMYLYSPLEAGVEETVMYLLFQSGDVTEEFMTFRFDGLNFMKASSVIMVTEELSFSKPNVDGYNESTWKTDNAIKITLGDADYVLYDETSKYSNFDLRDGQNPESELVRIISGMLDANHSPVEDQPYLVTYAYYDGASGTATIRLIKKSGVWGVDKQED